MQNYNVIFFHFPMQLLQRCLLPMAAVPRAPVRLVSMWSFTIQQGQRPAVVPVKQNTLSSLWAHGQALATKITTSVMPIGRP